MKSKKFGIFITLAFFYFPYLLVLTLYSSTIETERERKQIIQKKNNPPIVLGRKDLPPCLSLALGSSL